MIMPGSNRDWRAIPSGSAAVKKGGIRT
jgi:hypothetical protein